MRINSKLFLSLIVFSFLIVAIPGEVAGQLDFREDLVKPTVFTPYQGVAVMIGVLTFFLLIAIATRIFLVKDTHSFLVADRSLGMGLGFGSVMAAWYWGMGLMASGAVGYL